LVWFGAGGILSTIGTVILVGWLFYPTERVVWQSCQPDDITYKSFDPYCLSVIEITRPIDRFWLEQRRYYVFIGPGTGFPSYGHVVEHDFFPGQKDRDTYIRNCTVTWTIDGVTLEQESGHRLFIPKKSFIGGR
jgi:hypothetical protein